MFTTRSWSLACLLSLAAFWHPGSYAAEISNRIPSDLEIGYLPMPGSVSSTNPPAMAWLNEPCATSWTIEIATNSDFEKPDVTVKDWPWLLYTHTEPLHPRDYFWRYRFADRNGKMSEWSQIRSFSIATTATEFPRPSTVMLQKMMPVGHPRMFTTPEKLPALRATMETSSPEFLKLLKAADSYVDADLMPEPKPWTGGVWNVEEWRAYLSQIGPATSKMDTLAFAWMLTGREEYGKRAKAHLMNFASWDPEGPSNMRINDEVGMPVLHSISRTYDWIYPLLDADDKLQILKVILTRGEEAFKRMRGKPYEQFVHNSHFGRMWHFLGEAGVAFYGEIPEAEKWLNYAMTIFYGWYPYWGDEDGGWAEGIAYWSSYNTRVTWWLDLMRETLGIDGAQKPFYANVADFPLYICPPGHPVAGFGDFSERPPAGPSLASTVSVFALLRQNSAWQWYADEGGGSLGSGPFGYLRSLRTQPVAKAPAEIPLLKVFQKSGFAAFHTDLVNPEKNLHVAMRCSEFGNVSHSHNDQNAIIMSTYGEPLLVNTGRRDFYGSPFCKEYYWHTQSHNSLLIDGKGQERGQNTTGSILASGTEGTHLAWAVGDATNAYPGLAKLYRRWMIFLPDYGAVMVDEIDTTASEVSLLFHARAPFDIRQNGSLFALEKGKATLRGILPAGVKTSQTDQYPVPMHNGIEPLFDEWHLKVDVPTEQKSTANGRVKINGRNYIVTFLEVANEWLAAFPGSEATEVTEAGNKLVIRKRTGEENILDLELDPETLSVVRHR